MALLVRLHAAAGASKGYRTNVWSGLEHGQVRGSECTARQPAERRAWRRPPRCRRLAAQAEAGDQLPVPLVVGPGQVAEQTAPLANHHEKPAPAVLVLLVLREVGLHLADARGQQRNLHARRARIRLMNTVLLDDLVPGLLQQGHARFPPSTSRRLF